VLAKDLPIYYNYADIEIHTESDGRLVNSSRGFNGQKRAPEEKTGGLK
jgi:hypothetical protein